MMKDKRVVLRRDIALILAFLVLEYASLISVQWIPRAIGLSGMVVFTTIGLVFVYRLYTQMKQLGLGSISALNEYLKTGIQPDVIQREKIGTGTIFGLLIVILGIVALNLFLVMEIL